MRVPSVLIRGASFVAMLAAFAACSTAGGKPVESASSEAEPEPGPASLESSDEARAESGVAAEAEPAPLKIPETCAEPDADICAPPEEFTERLCQRTRPGLPFLLFKKGTPWTRGYIRVNTEAWYAGGGPASPEKVEVGEEVLIVASRTGNSSGIKVSGSGSYDVYRWNGSCVSLMADEVTQRRIGMPKVAPIDWKRLADETREALLSDKGVAFRHEMFEKHCKRGKWESKACKHHRGALFQIVAAYVRDGHDVPVPLGAD